MRTKSRFLWFATACLLFTIFVISVFGALFWRQLTLDEKLIIIQVLKNHFVYFFAAAILLMIAFGFIIDWIFRLYIIPISKIAEEIELIHTVNPSLRIDIDGSHDVNRLVNWINKTAQNYETLRYSVEKQISLAKAGTESEKNILATVMSELPEGVIICTSEGQVLLYNRQAKAFLEDAILSGEKHIDAPKRTGRFIGLGRSIFGVIDKTMILHALNEITSKLEAEHADPVAFFVVPGKNNTLLRTEAVPILNSIQNQMTGFILILHDITRQLAFGTQHHHRFLSISRKFRAALAGINSAIELIQEYPTVSGELREKLLGIIRDESRALSRLVDKELFEFTHHPSTQWPLMPIPAGDLMESIRSKAESIIKGATITLANTPPPQYIKADSYTFILAVTFILANLSKEMGISKFDGHIEKETGGYIHLDFSWQGKAPRIETLRKWELRSLQVESEAAPFTLKEVIAHHNAELWTYADVKNADRSHLILYLPAIQPAETDRQIRKVTITLENRPEFYDFDLFHQAGQTPELERRSLTELVCTVFDTETTGLNPADGDEIIAIGAIRAVNGRLLHDEVYEQLVDPKRSIPWESINIHGIHPEMLQGQPTIDQVLPVFHKFAEGTVLVAHNAAFDMRMLQLKEAQTGIRFINPVLDTMHLSSIIHPAHAHHTISAIAKRLGISVLGRHTALGDAITTGEIFLKMIPLLREKGIFTLKEAVMASRKSYYSRMKY